MLMLTVVNRASTTATVQITGTNIDTNKKSFEVYLCQQDTQQRISLWNTYKIDGGFTQRLTIDGLDSNQEYYFQICAFQWINGQWKTDPDSDSNYGFIQINAYGGGGGEVPSGDWTSEPVTSIQIQNETSITEEAGFPRNKTLDYWQITFESTGTWHILAQNSNSYYAYLTTNFSYDNSQGVPNSGVISSYTSSGPIDFSVSVSAGSSYYFWLRTSDGIQGNEQFDITFTQVPPLPTYRVDIENRNQIKFTVNNRQNYYLRFYVKLRSTDELIYDSNEYYGLLTQNIFTTPSLSYNTRYIVNVGCYNGSNTSSTQQLLGKQYITTLSQQIDSYVYIYTGGSTGWQKAIPYIYTTENGWLKAEAYVYTGSEWRKCGG